MAQKERSQFPHHDNFDLGSPQQDQLLLAAQPGTKGAPPEYTQQQGLFSDSTESTPQRYPRKKKTKMLSDDLQECWMELFTDDDSKDNASEAAAAICLTDTDEYEEDPEPSDATQMPDPYDASQSETSDREGSRTE